MNFTSFCQCSFKTKDFLFKRDSDCTSYNINFKNEQYDFPDSGQLIFSEKSQLLMYMIDLKTVERSYNDTVIYEGINGFLYSKDKKVIIKDSDEKIITLDSYMIEELELGYKNLIKH